MSFSIRSSQARLNPTKYYDQSDKSNPACDKFGKYINYEIIINKKDLTTSGISLIDIADNATLSLPYPKFNLTEKEIFLLNRDVTVVIKCQKETFVLNDKDVYVKLYFDNGWNRINK